MSRVTAQGADFWPLQVARELDDAILHLRINELEIAMLVFKSVGERRAFWPMTTS
jgi:benzoyl-CoA-dihydrodiol lyase